MNIFVWIAVAALLSMYVGVFASVLITIGLALFTDFFVAFLRIRKELRHQRIRNENVLVNIEVHESCGQPLYLVFNLPDNKFLLQGISIEEVSKALIDRFKNKTVYVQKENDIVPLFTSAENS